MENYERLKSAMEDRGGRLVVQDLSWTRTFHFRLSIAALFDDRMAQQALDEIESVVIESRPEQRMSALLLLSWIATQVGWQIDLEGCTLSSEEEVYGFVSLEGKKIVARLRWNADGAPVSLCEITAPGCVV